MELPCEAELTALLLFYSALYKEHNQKKLSFEVFCKKCFNSCRDSATEKVGNSLHPAPDAAILQFIAWRERGRAKRRKRARLMRRDRNVKG
jgi:hypothetical protein